MTQGAVRFSLALTLVTLAAAYGPVWAQVETGRITGTVSDAQGSVVPGATVIAKSVNSGFTRETVSDADGKYVIANVSPDTYDVTVTLPGFKTATRRGVAVTVGADVAADARLEVGSVEEQITVVARQETIDTRTGEFRTTVNARQIIELPTLTRNPYDLVALSGNVREASSDEATLAQGAENVRGTGFSINGMRTASTNILLDGGDNNYLYVAGVGQEVPLDAVQEFSVVTNNFSAQFGRASGGIVNVVTKSGSNRFSGTGYEFFRNDKMSSNTPANEAFELPKGKFRRNQLGYSLGGPIVRDKIHFFSSLEYIGITSRDTLISWIATPQLLAASAPATQAYFAQYGAGANITGEILTREQVSAIVGTAAGPFNNLPASLPVFGLSETSIPTNAGAGSPGDTYQTINKIDFVVNNSTRATISYAFLKKDNEPGTQSSSPYPKYNTPLTEQKHNFNASMTQVWANNFTSQSRLVWNRIREDQPINGSPEPGLFMNPGAPAVLQGQPIMFPGYLPTIPNASIPVGGPQKLLQLHQDQTYLRGNHDIRFGGSYVRVMDDHEFAAFQNAREFLSTTANRLNSLNNLVSGRIARFQKAINPQGYPGGSFTTPAVDPTFLSRNRYNDLAFYAIDNWSIGDRLKLNLGVRYEYFGPQKKSDPKYDSNFYWTDEDFDLPRSTPADIFAQLRGGQVLPSNESPIGTLWAADKNNFAPRLGFAWDVNGDGRTAVRGGYGIAYERNFGNVTYNVLLNPPLYAVATLDATATAPVPLFTENFGPFAAPGTQQIPGAQLRHVDHNIKTAYAHIYGLSLTNALAGGLTASVEYNGSSGRKLYDLADINRAGAPVAYGDITGVDCITAFPAACVRRPNTQYGTFGTRSNRGQSQYHGMVFSLETSQLGTTGLALTSKYALSKVKDNLSGTFADADNSIYLNAGQGYLDPYDPMLDYGYAGFDARHRLSASAIWSLPFGGDGPWLGGWQVNALFTARSGYPFSVGDCDHGVALCMRARDPIGIDKHAIDGPATLDAGGNIIPNEYLLLDLAPLKKFAGTYFHPVQGTSDFGPYPSDMTERNAFRGPGAWKVDLILGKRFRFGNKAALVRFEAYNVFNHHNMYANTDATFVTADPAVDDRVTGFRDDWRRMQLGFKFEF